MHYTEDDVTISKWLKEPDGSHFIVVACPDGFKGQIPQSELASLSDDSVLADVEAIAKTWIQTICTATHSLRNNVKAIDMLNNG